MAARFDEVQKSAVQGIPTDQLLVETASPNLWVREIILRRTWVRLLIMWLKSER
ncbi:hypothetical protein DPMN_113398 [Dreissena polymorpha]|uniref:Uncharacterized protein n=1 Tax=Dreissena polymorpha TaxID=45954 RepID=A0A9D4KI80_DREPO|nr:hypothetical protein DPMN_113398 [Dreissena polymorpha]